MISFAPHQVSRPRSDRRAGDVEHADAPTHEPQHRGRRHKLQPTIAARREAHRISGEVARLTSKSRGAAMIVARFPPLGESLEPLVASIAPRAIEVRVLDTVVGETPVTRDDAVHRVVRTAALTAAAVGALGALAGALVIERAALFPSLGWIPGPLVGAAIGGGVAGAFGFLVAAIAMLVVPSLAFRAAPDHASFVIVRTRAFDLDAVIERLLEAGGTIAAIGEG